LSRRPKEEYNERNKAYNETTNDNEEASIGGSGFSVPSLRTIVRVAMFLQ
jgi:hypothetical protein